MSEADMMIAAAEARRHCKNEPDLRERVLKAMRACRNHWMVTDESRQFRSAIAAALLESEGDDRDRIERSARALNRISAMLAALQSGVPVDLEKMAAEPAADDLLPLRKMWDETSSFKRG